MKRREPSLRQLTWIVARDVNRTFGGGQASIELLRRTFIANGSIDDDGNAGLIAVSRLTPGTNVLAYTVGLGWRLHRWGGALAALTAASLPASVLVCVLAGTLVRVQDYPVVQMLLAVGVLIATVLVFSSAGSLLRPYVRRSMLARSAIVGVVAAALFVADVTPVRILLLSACLSVVMGSAKRPYGRG